MARIAKNAFEAESPKLAAPLGKAIPMAEFGEFAA